MGPEGAPALIILKTILTVPMTPITAVTDSILPPNAPAVSTDFAGSGALALRSIVAGVLTKDSSDLLVLGLMFQCCNIGSTCNFAAVCFSVKFTIINILGFGGLLMENRVLYFSGSTFVKLAYFKF